MPRFIIHHVTKYTYPEPVRDSANKIMLYPLKDDFQEVQQQRISITGEPNVEVFKDYYGNETGSFMNVQPHAELRIDSTISVVTKARNWTSPAMPVAEQWQQLESLQFAVPYIDFLKQEKFAALQAVRSVLEPYSDHHQGIFELSQELNHFVYEHFQYIKGVTSVETTLDEIWELKAGVCQDFAHMLLAMLRLLKIPARYVSGYVCPKDQSLRGEGATHAWVEAFIPAMGWVGLDPTNDCVVNDLHVRLAIGRNFTDCSPVKGTYKGTAKQTLEVGVSVEYEDGVISRETAIIAPPLVVTATVDEDGSNSFRRHMEMMQQQ